MTSSKHAHKDVLSNSLNNIVCKTCAEIIIYTKSESTIFFYQYYMQISHPRNDTALKSDQMILEIGALVSALQHAHLNESKHPRRVKPSIGNSLFSDLSIYQMDNKSPLYQILPKQKCDGKHQSIFYSMRADTPDSEFNLLRAIACILCV